MKKKINEMDSALQVLETKKGREETKGDLKGY